MKTSKDEKTLDSDNHDTKDDFTMIMTANALLTVTELQEKQKHVCKSGATNNICTSCAFENLNTPFGSKLGAAKAVDHIDEEIIATHLT